MEIKLKCKDFDAWVSFLGRLGKIGSNYFIINDIILASVKGTKSGSEDKIPGRHIIRDPLFIDDEDCYLPDTVYYMLGDTEYWCQIFKTIKENNKDARKDIKYIREKDGIYVQFLGVMRYQMFALLDRNYLEEKEYENYLNCANGIINSGINWFNDALKIPEELNSEWVNMSEGSLIGLRDGNPLMLHQVVSDKPIWSRIAKSVFTMAGVSRMGNPIASKAEYSFIPSLNNTNEPIGMLKIHANYKAPADSKIIKVECIHEYMILVYKEEDEE